jgi:hypothetical protein
MALAYLTINLDAFTGDDRPPLSSYSTITLDPALTAGQVVDLSDYITPGAPLTPDQAAALTVRIVALEAAPPGGGGSTAWADAAEYDPRHDKN